MATDPIKDLEQAVEAVEYSLNSGDGSVPNHTASDLADAANTVIAAWHRTFRGADPALWADVLDAFRRSRAKGFTWDRGEVAKALHRLDHAANGGGS